MRESRFGFQYTWADLQPIRALAVIVLVAQVVGALSGLALAPHIGWFHRLWFGAAVATFPAFVIGALVQSRLRPGSLSQNLVMVRRLGVIAAILLLAAVFMPQLGLQIVSSNPAIERTASSVLRTLPATAHVER